MRFAAFANFLMALLVLGPAHAEERISYGRFQDMVLYRPVGEVKEFVIFLSGDGGWSQSAAQMAQALVAEGAMVVGIDLPGFSADLEADEDDCEFPAGDLENLAHYLQGYAKLPTFFAPLLVGYSSGAAFAYAMLAQAPAETFAGAISLGFCPELNFKKPLCKGEDLRFKPRKDGRGMGLLPTKKLRAPWQALHETQDPRCAVETAQTFINKVPSATFKSVPSAGHGIALAPHWIPHLLDAYQEFSGTHVAAPPPSLQDLPVVEVPATGTSDTFAILLSGDGGWAGLDKEVAAALAAKGVAVVGLDSLRYFWTARTPQGVADDLARVLHYYATHWNKSRALLIGYSQGADVLPFAVNRLSVPARALVAQTVLMGIGETASFEFHLGNWLNSDAGGLPIKPEFNQLSANSTLCLYGQDDDESLCPKIAAGHVHAQSLPGGHHFDGDYAQLAALILARIKFQ